MPPARIQQCRCVDEHQERLFWLFPSRTTWARLQCLGPDANKCPMTMCVEFDDANVANISTASKFIYSIRKLRAHHRVPLRISLQLLVDPGGSFVLVMQSQTAPR